MQTGVAEKVSRLKITVTVIVIAAVICLLYWPTLRWLVNSWLSSDYYSHGFLVPVVVLFFAWTKRKQLKSERSIVFSIILITIAAALYASSLIIDLRFLGALSLLIIITAVVSIFFGYGGIRSLWFSLCFLLFMVPFPFITNLAVVMQQIAIISSSSLLAALRLPITISGAEIYLPLAAFTIGLPCSGINSFIALPALTAVYVYIMKGNVGKRIGLFILAFAVAIGANILRITSIITIAYYVDIPVATGWYHDISSPIFFFIGFGIIILIGWLTRLKINYEALNLK